jgi:hypothetical protein
MSWQQDLFEQLRNREWHAVGDLFELFERAIPLHYAMRHYVLVQKPDDVPSNFEARWRYFRFVVARIGVERDTSQLRWNTQVRLKYLTGRACGECGGPVVRATWSGAGIQCLACTAPPVPAPEVVAPIPAPVLQVIPHIETSGGSIPLDLYETAHRFSAWQYQSRRAFAEFIQRTRLRLSITRILKEWERWGDLSRFMANRGKPQISADELARWAADYQRQHPPP